MSLPKVVFVLGLPGSGKGTQCQKIVNNFKCVHLSAGELLRQEVNKPSSTYKQLIDKHMREGTIVPVEVTCALLEEAMKEFLSKDPSREWFLIDGFPRNQNNLDGWKKQMDGKAEVKFVMNFDCSEQECIERCLSRGEAGSGRVDDNIESLKKRINTHVTSTQPIIDHYQEQGLVKRINANNTPDNVFELVKEAFNECAKVD